MEQHENRREGRVTRRRGGGSRLGQAQSQGERGVKRQGTAQRRVLNENIQLRRPAAPVKAGHRRACVKVVPTRKREQPGGRLIGQEVVGGALGGNPLP